MLMSVAVIRTLFVHTNFRNRYRNANQTTDRCYNQDVHDQVEKTQNNFSAIVLVEVHNKLTL